ncbi:chemotaxis protein CheX [Alteribacillus persepolensis]|uniref:Chemotaxis protein CheX n=1 Tax=Alteribacillus persepolensis TaxID=568899 RepID=A0A1G8GM62_9BACI|nr:chemotaxis protein CheX [Alteribacillus persepolensis]SDH95397.1 chemotaxis protein CheX [Alteribacillus persepolensis]
MPSSTAIEKTCVAAITNAAAAVVNDHLGMDASFAVPYQSGSQFQSFDVSVVMGINGTLEGQMICSMENKTALSVVSTMMGGMEMTALGDMGWSAIQEFGNWIAGKTAAELAESVESIDISPPMVNEGVSVFRMEGTFITLPLRSAAGQFSIHISIKENIS